MTEKQDFTKFKFAEKFERLPHAMRLAIHTSSLLDLFDTTSSWLDLSSTRVDMVPAGLKGVEVVVFNNKPLYIAPDYEGLVMVPGGMAGVTDMQEEDIEAAKERYKANQEMVEKPRYVEEEDGSLSLCSLPKNMHLILKNYSGSYLDLTETDVIEKQNLEGFKDIILYPKRKQLTMKSPQKIAHHKGCQMVHQKPKIKE